MKSASNHGWSPRILHLVLFIMVVSFAYGLVGCGGAQSADEKKIKDAEWHYKMGQGYFQSHEVPLAIRELTQALNLDPDHAKANHLMGLIYMGRRDYPRALNHFNLALESDPDFHIARNNRGSLYLAMERWRKAEEDFEALLQEPLYSTPELAHNNIAWAYYNRRQYSDALQHYEMATFLKPELCIAHNGLGLTYLAMNNWSSAKESFRNALRRCPSNYAEPHFNLGKLYQKTGERRKAAHHFQRCIEIEPMTNLGRRCREYHQVTR